MAYSVKEVNDEILKEHITPFFKKLGYKKHAYTYRKSENGLVYLFNFQSSGYNNIDYAAYYINCGIYFNEFETLVGENVLVYPKEVDCLYRVRIEDISNFGKQSIEIIESSEVGKIVITNELLAALEQAHHYLSKVNSMEALVNFCFENGTLYETKMLTYLCVKKEMKLLDIYFQTFAENFKDDERYLFMENYLNKTLIANGITPMKFKTTMSVPLEKQRKIED